MPSDTDLPAGFPYSIHADGETWDWTGKIGTTIATGKPAAEYGTDSIRYWRQEDGTIQADCPPPRIGTDP